MLYNAVGGGGGVRFPGKKGYEGVRFNVIRVTRGWVGVKFPGKKRYVTLEVLHFIPWQICSFLHQLSSHPRHSATLCYCMKIIHSHNSCLVGYSFIQPSEPKMPQLWNGSKESTHMGSVDWESSGLLRSTRSTYHFFIVSPYSYLPHKRLLFEYFDKYSNPVSFTGTECISTNNTHYNKQ